MDYKSVADTSATAEIPKEGIYSRVLQKDEHVNIMLFGFSTGQELSIHSAPPPAGICILNGEADITLGGSTSGEGRSFAYMPPLLPHTRSRQRVP
jgi:quercetin dioxygenase-like cupin family protein